MSEPLATSDLLLVVDDNLIKRYTTVRPLELAGFTVLQAATGEDALRLIREHTLSVVVLDVKLPDLDGFEVCRRIKADPKTANLLVLHFSAHRTSGHDLAKGLEGGADAYLAVPVEAEVLVATVRSLLRLHRAEEAARAASHYWRATFDAISDAVLLVDPDGIVTRGNAAAGVLTGIATADLPGTPFPAVLARLGIKARPEVGRAFGETGATEVQLGDDRWMRMTVDTLGSAPGVSGMVCTLSDVTVRVQAEQSRAAIATRNERIAETLQRSLLLTPDTKAFPGVDVASVYEAAWDESLVGGDFSDVFAVDSERIALVVGDVTGKGLAAALYTAEIKFALRAFLRESSNPARALYRLNHYLLESRRLETMSSTAADQHKPEKYVSLALAVLHPASGVTVCAAAGAEPPLILRAASAETLVIDAACGPLLAIEDDSDYQTAEATLQAQDLFLLATDGITEARSPHHRRAFFGLEGMAQAARDTFDGTARQVADAVVRTALQFAGGHQADDICLLAVRCTGKTE